MEFDLEFILGIRTKSGKRFEIFPIRLSTSSSVSFS